MHGILWLYLKSAQNIKSNTRCIITFTSACTPDVQPEREGFYLLCLYLLTFEYISQIADVKKPQLMLRLFTPLSIARDYNGTRGRT